jgi:hypothetical protein
MPNIKTPYRLNSGANKNEADVKRTTLLKIREVFQGHFKPLIFTDNKIIRQARRLFLKRILFAHYTSFETELSLAFFRLVESLKTYEEVSWT